MKNFKKIILSFVLVVSSLFFFGCSTISLSTTLGKQGNISTTIKVDLKDVAQSKRTTLYKIFKTYYSQLDKAYEDNLIYYFSQVYNSDSFDELDRLTKLQYITTRNILYLAGETEDSSLQDLDNYKFFCLKKDFASIYAYLMYFCPNAFEYDEENNKVKISSDYHSLVDVPMASSDNDIEESGNIFIKQYIQDFCPFYYNNEEPAFLYDASVPIHVSQGDKLADVIKDSCGFTEEEVEYYFSFTTPYKRLHSSGQIESTSSGYTHSWVLGSVNSKVEVWRNYANYAPWYGFVILISLIGIIVSFAVVRIVNNRKKKKGLEMLEKINDFQQGKK